MKKYSIVLALTLFIAIIPKTSAEFNTSTDSAKPTLTREEYLEKQQQIKNEFMMTQKNTWEDYRTLMEQKKAAMQASISAERERFKEKLEELKDQRKKSIVEKVDFKLSPINKNGTDRLGAAIDRLEKLLDKFKSRAAKAKAAGKDTTEVDAAITAADLAIANAKDVVATQSAKSYTAKITDEKSLKLTVGAAVSSLNHDLHAAFESVKLAKEKVMDVARALAKLHLEEKEATPSATIKPTIVTPTI